MAECPFCSADIREEVSLYGGRCESCLIEIPGEEAPTDPGEDAPTEEMNRASGALGPGPISESSPSASMYALGGFAITALAIGLYVWSTGSDEGPENAETAPIVLGEQEHVNRELPEIDEADPAETSSNVEENGAEEASGSESDSEVVANQAPPPVTTSAGANTATPTEAPEEEVVTTTESGGPGTYNNRGMAVATLGGATYTREDVEERANTILETLQRQLGVRCSVDAAGEYVNYELLLVGGSSNPVRVNVTVSPSPGVRDYQDCFLEETTRVATFTESLDRNIRLTGRVVFE